MAVRLVFSEELWESAEPREGVTVEWIRDTGRRLRIWLATSLLEAEGHDLCNTLSLATHLRRRN